MATKTTNKTKKLVPIRDVNAKSSKGELNRGTGVKKNLVSIKDRYPKKESLQPIKDRYPKADPSRLKPIRDKSSTGVNKDMLKPIKDRYPKSTTTAYKEAKSEKIAMKNARKKK